MEGEEVDLRLAPIAGDHHLACDLRKVDLVPIEEVYGTETRKEEQHADREEDQLESTARWHGPKVTAEIQRLPSRFQPMMPVRARK